MEGFQLNECHYASGQANDWSNYHGKSVWQTRKSDVVKDDQAYSLLWWNHQFSSVVG